MMKYLDVQDFMNHVIQESLETQLHSLDLQYENIDRATKINNIVNMEQTVRALICYTFPHCDFNLFCVLNWQIFQLDWTILSSTFTCDRIAQW